METLRDEIGGPLCGRRFTSTRRGGRCQRLGGVCKGFGREISFGRSRYFLPPVGNHDAACSHARNWMQRASFLAYAIANGWGRKAGGAYSRNTLDAVAKEWRLGGGRCPEVSIGCC